MLVAGVLVGVALVSNSFRMKPILTIIFSLTNLREKLRLSFTAFTSRKNDMATTPTSGRV